MLPHGRAGTVPGTMGARAMSPRIPVRGLRCPSGLTDRDSIESSVVPRRHTRRQESRPGSLQESAPNTRASPCQEPELSDRSPGRHRSAEHAPPMECFPGAHQESTRSSLPERGSRGRSAPCLERFGEDQRRSMDRPGAALAEPAPSGGVRLLGWSSLRNRERPIWTCRRGELESWGALRAPRPIDRPRKRPISPAKAHPIGCAVQITS